MSDETKIKGRGATPHAGGVAFRVWAPHAQRVSIIGSFNDWSGDKHPMQAENGDWYADVAEARVGDQYRFLLTTAKGEFKRIDPYAREVTNSVGNAIVHDPSFDWAGDDLHLAPWNELVIYELHVGTFNDEENDNLPGKFASVSARLGHLKKLGVNAIQIMPVAEFATDRSWGYNPSHIFSVETAYGGPLAFKRFVKRAHEHGMAVILDVVYNHLGPSDLDLWQFDGWSENNLGGIYFYNDERATTPWGDTRPDYGRGEVRQFILDNAYMWLHRIELGQGVVGWTGSHGERLLANDVRTESRYTNFYPDLIPTQSELCVPIRVGNETVGVLDVQSPQLDVFDQNDVRVIETLADQIAVAIENARLYEAVRRELAERKRAEEHSAAFSALGQRLNSTTNPEEAARIIVGVADQLVGWDACFLSLYSAEEDLTYLVLSVDIINGQRVDIHTGVVGETPTPIVRRTMKEGGQLILRNQAAEYADVVRFGDETRLSASLMFVPIRNVANIIGVLSIQSYTPMAYDQESLGTLRSLADHCGGALERIRAEDQLRRFSTELAQSNEELKRFTYTISHDLRAPLVNLKGFAGELALALKVVRSALHAVLPQLDEEHRSAVTTALLADVPEALGFIDASVTRMDHYINALLKLSRLGRRELVLERVDMEALTQATLETLAYQIEQRQARVTAGPLPAVVADRTALEQIMSNLLNNALIYLEPGRAGEIEISGERNAEETLFHVRDNGRGIAQEDMDKVFAPFRRAGKQDVPGEGMGLAYVQALVRRHGGRIGCESELGVGTTFTFTLPH